jgi:hypothetical protein
VSIESLRRQIQRMKAQLAAENVYALKPGGGMRALRESMMAEAARRAREQGLIAPIDPSVGNTLPRAYASPAEAMAALRRAMLDEQRRRAEWFAKPPLDELLKEPATHDGDEPDELNGERAGAPAIEEEQERCMAPATETHSQDS